MKDVYLMNRETGEILPSEEVFQEFYKTHTILESVFDEWVETDMLVDGTHIGLPIFSATVNAVHI